MFGAESASRPDSLQRAGALGLMRPLLAVDVVDAEGLDDCAVGEERTQGKRTNGDSQKTTSRNKMDVKHCKMTRTLFHLEPNVVRPRLEKCADDAAVLFARAKMCVCARVW